MSSAPCPQTPSVYALPLTSKTKFISHPWKIIIFVSKIREINIFLTRETI
jgi:hypothetical protein